MRHRIFVVAHDVMLRSTLARWLMPAGYIVELAESDKRAREVLANHRVALAILVSGRFRAPAFELRESGVKLIVVTERSQGRGPFGSPVPAADGYVSLPLDEQEVLACVKSVLQAQPGNEDEATRAAEILSFDGFTIDLAERSLRDGSGSEVPLTRSEFTLLVVLAGQAGRVLSRDQLRMRRAAVGRSLMIAALTF